MADGSIPTPRARPAIRVRKLDHDFSEVPRYWFFDSALASHLANGLNVLFPDGERFFIRSVRHYLEQVDDPALKARVRAFFGQEGAHGHAHEQAFAILQAQGYEIDRWLEKYRALAFERLSGLFPPIMQLSVTVALEHFTATMAEQALATGLLEDAHPAMSRLLRWHACEEIEHKAVAFDVLQRVDPRYHIRVAGLAIATVGLLGFWRSATKHLIDQDLRAGRITRARLKREGKDARARGQNRTWMLRAIGSYLRPGFHPDDHDNYGLAQRYLESIGRLEG
jgi:predicted metal-dependent hydrolase